MWVALPQKTDKIVSEYGHINNLGPVISFNIDEVHSYDLAQLLAQQKIYIRSGHHCAQPIMKRLNVPATNRASFYIYNTFSEIDSLIEGLIKAVDLFN